MEKIAELVRERKITGIADLRDESDRTGTRLVVELKRDATPRWSSTSSTRTPSCRRPSGSTWWPGRWVPHTLNLEQVIRHYIVHQMEVVERRTQFRLGRAEARAHIVEGLLIALDNIDEVVQVIGRRRHEKARAALMKRFKLSEIQATHILDMPLRRLTALETASCARRRPSWPS